MKNLNELKIIIRGAGDLATGVALRLYRSGFKRMLLLETAHPLAVRRLASFSEAVALGEVSVEGIRSIRIDKNDCATWPVNDSAIPLVVDQAAKSISSLRPDVVIDAIIAKKNTGTKMENAPLVIGLGPGFTAGVDVHCVIETMRGHNLGRVIYQGAAQPDTAIPGSIDGYTSERLLRAPANGTFLTTCAIGDRVNGGDRVATVDGVPVTAAISGVLRGLLRNETPVIRGTKLGDIDPRGKADFCATASDKALAIGGGVLEAILYHSTKIDSEEET